MHDIHPSLFILHIIVMCGCVIVSLNEASIRSSLVARHHGAAVITSDRLHICLRYYGMLPGIVTEVFTYDGDPESSGVDG